MAGKICMGNDRVPNDPLLSRAYCEGRAQKVSGNSYSNPHAVVDNAAHNAFDRGFISNVPGGTNETTFVDCCCDPRIASENAVPDVVGSPPGEANGILLVAGYNPKPDNTNLGLIVSQDPAAGTLLLTSLTVTYVAGA